MDLEAIKNLIDKVEIVCFDIFDTIVSRRCYPDYTKSLFCKFLNNTFSLNLSDTELLRLRLECEQELYRMNEQIHNDSEFKYENLIERLYLKLKNNNLINKNYEHFYNLAEEIEVNIEKAIEYVQQDIVELFKYCKSKGKKIICISDMYLTKHMLQEIFKFHKIDKYIDEIFVSSEFIKSKRTGNLYNLVVETYGLTPDRFLMIGDNEHSDYNIPQNLGLKSFRINHHGIEHFYDRNKSDINDPSYIKELSYILKNESFNNEYNIYKFINDLYFKMLLNGVKSVNIDNKLIRKRFIEFSREILICNDFSISSSNKCDCIVSFNDNHLSATLGEFTIDAACDLDNLNLEIFRDIVRLLQNKLNEKSLVLKASIIQKNDQFLEPSEKVKNKLRNTGVSYSPLFYDFVDWFLDDCQKKKIDTIYFFTREGEFFEQIARKVKKYDRINKNILEVSRLATFCASLREISIDEMMRVWNQYYIQNMSTFCKTLGLNVDDFIAVFEKHDLRLNESILFPYNDIRIRKMFNDDDFNNLLSKKIEDKKELVLKYFKSKGLDNSSGKIAIVDIGWRGTIQDNICYLLPNKKIYGYYFGLYDYFNAQPINCEKMGYLNQFNNGLKFLENVTPIEMLCNSPYGSTVGYDDNKKICAIRKIDEKENQSYDKCTKYIQEGVIQNIDNLYDLKISDNTILDILNNIVFNPTKEVASMYFKLKHNEEFGLGKYVNKNSKFNYINLFLAPVSKKYRNRFRESIKNSTWNQGYLKVNKLGVLNSWYKKKINNFSRIGKKRIAWFLPEVIKGSGGHRTIIQNANALVKAGYSCDLYFDEDFYSTSETMKNLLVKYFGECLCDVYIGSILRGKYDLVIATHAVLTADYAKNCDCLNKAYFIQDFEPWFMPMGELYISMEETYNYNFKGVSIGRWLAHKIENEYNTKMKYFNFCADLNIYHKLDNIDKEDAVCFIYQPEKPRRCSSLGLRALSLVKKLRPEIKIYLYGSNSNATGYDFDNLHIINLEECNKLYNKCRVGLCISASNPSRIPFEMMASGLPVVDLYKENNLYDMPDEGVLLADATPESIATAIIKIYDDKKLADKMSKFGQKYMKDYSIEKGFEQFVASIDSMFDDNYDCNISVDKLYNKQVIKASDEVLKYSNLVAPIPYVKQTSKITRKIVKSKKHVKKTIKKLVKKVFKM